MTSLHGFSKETLIEFITHSTGYVSDPARVFLTLVEIEQKLHGSPDAVGAPPRRPRVYTLGHNPPLRIQHEGVLDETAEAKCFTIDEHPCWVRKSDIHAEDPETQQVVVSFWVVRAQDLHPFVVPG